jgi:hypothetical protein
MLAFVGWYDEHWEYDDPDSPLNARQIPTIQEINDTLGYLGELTKQQILKGQAYYYGYECHTHCNNNVPDISTAQVDKVVDRHRTPEQSKRYKRNKLIADMRNLGLGDAEIVSLMARAR